MSHISAQLNARWSLSLGWGRIVNIASDLGLSGAINKVPYVATKHGVVGMTKVREAWPR